MARYCLVNKDTGEVLETISYYQIIERKEYFQEQGILVEAVKQRADKFPYRNNRRFHRRTKGINRPLLYDGEGSIRSRSHP